MTQCCQCNLTFQEYIQLQCNHNYCLKCLSQIYQNQNYQKKLNVMLQCKNCKQYTQMDIQTIQTIENIIYDQENYNFQILKQNNGISNSKYISDKYLEFYCETCDIQYDNKSYNTHKFHSIQKTNQFIENKKKYLKSLIQNNQRLQIIYLEQFEKEKQIKLQQQNMKDKFNNIFQDIIKSCQQKVIFNIQQLIQFQQQIDEIHQIPLNNLENDLKLFKSALSQNDIIMQILTEQDDNKILSYKIREFQLDNIDFQYDINGLDQLEQNYEKFNNIHKQIQLIKDQQIQLIKDQQIQQTQLLIKQNNSFQKKSPYKNFDNILQQFKKDKYYNSKDSIKKQNLTLDLDKKSQLSQQLQNYMKSYRQQMMQFKKPYNLNNSEKKFKDISIFNSDSKKYIQKIKFNNDSLANFKDNYLKTSLSQDFKTFFN